MNVRLSVLLVALVGVASVALAPSLIVNSPADAQTTGTKDPHWCRHQTDKSSSWIFGCQNGWWDHDHCQDFRPESGHFAKGYVVGWNIGYCK